VFKVADSEITTRIRTIGILQVAKRDRFYISNVKKRKLPKEKLFGSGASRSM